MWIVVSKMASRLNNAGRLAGVVIVAGQVIQITQK